MHFIYFYQKYTVTTVKNNEIVKRNNLIQVIEKTKQTNKQEIGLAMQ